MTNINKAAESPPTGWSTFDTGDEGTTEAGDQRSLLYSNVAAASTNNELDDYETHAVTRDAARANPRPLVLPLTYSSSSFAVATAAAHDSGELLSKNDLLNKGDKSGAAVFSGPRVAFGDDDKKEEGWISTTWTKEAASPVVYKKKTVIPTGEEYSKERPTNPRTSDAVVLTDQDVDQRRSTGLGTGMAVVLTDQKGKKRLSTSLRAVEAVVLIDQKGKKHGHPMPRVTETAVLNKQEDSTCPATSSRAAAGDPIVLAHQTNRKRRPTSPCDKDYRFIIKQDLRKQEGIDIGSHQERDDDHLQPTMLSPPTAEVRMSAKVSSLLEDEDDLESQYDSEDEEEPIVCGVGIPAVARSSGMAKVTSSGSIRREGAEEFKEEIEATTPRRKTSDELNREAIDGVLAENININQTDAKGGKKSLPDIIDPTNIMRRHSSLAPCPKDLSRTEFSFGSAHSPTTTISPLCPPPEVARAASRDSPEYGRSAFGRDLLQDGEGEASSAHAGVLAFALPGAYSMPGIGNAERGVSTFSDLSDPLHERFHDDDEGLATSGAMGESASTRQARLRALAEEGSHSGLEAGHEFSPGQGGVVVNGQLVSMEDGLTDEQRAVRKWRRTKGLIGLGILAGAAIISAVVVITRSSSITPSSATSTDGTWEPLGATLTGPPIDDDLFFGNSVSISGDAKRLATGLPGIDKSNNDNDVGQVRIFDSEASEQWVLEATIDFEAREGRAGGVVSLSTDGRRVAVGSPAWSNEIGLVSIFEDTGNSVWQQIGSDISGRESDGGRGSFGKTVAISADGSIVAAGAPFANSQLASEGGVVRVYQEIQYGWVQIGTDIVSTRDRALLGISIALSADGLRLAIGATNFDTQVDVQVVGQVRVYDFDGTDWIQMGQILDGASEFENFGNAVALNAGGNFLAIGANGSPGSDNRVNSGKVQVFELVDALWTQVGGEILGRRSENLGASVALSDDSILAVGSPTYRETGMATGQVKVYSYSGITGWMQIANGINGSGDGETFGISVAISSDGTVVGAGAPKAGFDGGRVQEVGLVRMYHNTAFLEAEK